jgi:hypothetical protein
MGRVFALHLDWFRLPLFPDIFVNPRSSAIYEAPSWSWASVDCGIRYNRNLEISYESWFALFEVHLEHASDAYGPLKSGWLRLRGSLLIMRLTRPLEQEDQLPEQLYPTIQLHFSDSTYRNQGLELYLDRNPISEIPQPEGMTVYALPIGSYRHQLFVNLHLLLLKATGKKSGQYTRIEVLHLDSTAMEDFVSSYRR